MSGKRLGVLVSGRGSNMVAIARAALAGDVGYEVAVCVSDKSKAPALARARELGIPFRVVKKSDFADRAGFESAIGDVLDEHGVDLVILAGFMRLLSPYFVRRFQGRILNIHPSLLPAFPGLDAQKQAWEYGAKVSGVTIHFVDEGLDSGPVIFQYPVYIGDAKTSEEAAARILEYEHRFYPLVIDLVAAGAYRLEGRRVVLMRKIEEGFKGA